jgi:malate dehydrogenase
MVEAIIKDKKRILLCAVPLKDEYGMSNTFSGVPIKLGKKGVEQIIEVKLTPEEKAAFEKSAGEVKANIGKLTI